MELQFYYFSQINLQEFEGQLNAASRMIEIHGPNGCFNKLTPNISPAFPNFCQ
jgi:hypothetical protein